MSHIQTSGPVEVGEQYQFYHKTNARIDNGQQVEFECIADVTVLAINDGVYTLRLDNVIKWPAPGFGGATFDIVDPSNDAWTLVDAGTHPDA